MTRPSDEHKPGLPEDALERTENADIVPLQTPEALDKTRTDESATATPEQYLRRTQASESAFDTQTSGQITSFDDSESVPSALFDSPTDSGDSAKRFEILDEVGRGGTGRVYAMRDHSLDRTIAVKFLKGKKTNTARAGIKNRFLHEARVTAGLQHPNIMPVYDIGVTGSGKLFFTMKKIDGCTLGDAIRAEQREEPVAEELSSVEGKVRVFLKVCDAIAYAHHRGFVHQDIKPDNIMLGEFGEVLVLDWGSAVRRRGRNDKLAKQLHGTPAFMSPEQARREDVDERSDIYCIGASLFHSLLLRHPTWAEDAEVFWEKKGRGHIDPLASTERRRVPAALLSIVFKAMHPDPSRRYQSVQALADDLKAYQSGLAVSAHRENPFEMFARWYRKNARLFWIITVALVTVSSAAGLLFREKVKEWMTWRRFFSDDFGYHSTADPAANWEAYSSIDWWRITPEPFSDSSGWRAENGVLHGRNNNSGFHNITYKGRVPGDIRVEWTVSPLVQNRNLNCYIAGQNRLDGYTFHIGGFGDPKSCILTKGKGSLRLDQTTLPERLELGRVYRFRMEKEGNHIRFFFDGHKLIDYVDYDAFSGPGHQTFGFETCMGNHLWIDNVVVYHHPLPLKVSPLAAADRFYDREYYAEALEEYHELMATYPDHELAVSALFRIGQCLMHVDSTAEALYVFGRLERNHPEHELAAMALHERARILFAEGDTAEAENAYLELADRFPGSPVLRSAFATLSSRYHTHTRELEGTWTGDSLRTAALGAWLVRETRRVQKLGRRLGVSVENDGFLSRAARLLANMRNLSPDDVRTLFPEQYRIHAHLLYLYDQFERVLAEHPGETPYVAKALLAMGKYRELVQRCPEARVELAEALTELGLYAEVVRRVPEERELGAIALWKAGDFQRLFTEYSDQVKVCVNASYGLGLLGTVPSDTLSGVSAWTWVRLLREVYNRSDSALALAAGAPLEDYHTHRILVAAALISTGRPDSAASLLPSTPGYVPTLTHGLLYQGRYREALRRFGYRKDMESLILLSMGDFDAVVRRNPEHLQYVLHALCTMGRLEEVRATYPEREKLWAEYAAAVGDFAGVLQYPSQRNRCARALIELGRSEEVLKHYPDQRAACAEVLYRAGRADEALSRYPESRSRYCQWLLAQERYEEVVERFSDQVWEYSRALAALGRYDEIPFGQGRVRIDAAQYADLFYCEALDAHIGEEPDRAQRLLERPHLFYHFRQWVPLRFGEHFLGPVLRALAGDTAGIADEFVRIMDRYEVGYGRRLWFEAALLAGRITEERFLGQPYGFRADERLVLFRAVAADIRGDSERALDGYRRWAGMPDLLEPLELHDLRESVVLERFVQWRLEALGGEDNTPAASGEDGSRGPVLGEDDGVGT